MQPINRKPIETPENNFYGVDVNNRMAVEQEFTKLQGQHRMVTIVVIVLLLVIGFFIFDFIRVYSLGGRPIFAIQEKVTGGTKFTGIGYEVLYCDNGERHVDMVVYKKCGNGEPTTISNLVYKKFVDYATETKMLNNSKLESLEFISVNVDGKNDKDGTDYHVNLKYTCKKDGCLKLKKEFESTDNVHLYVRLDKFNDVYDIVYFKISGPYYDSLVEIYEENLKTYLIENQKADVANLKRLELVLEENHGKYKFRGTSYADSYLVRINYTCVDNSNTCIKAFDDTDMEGDFTNLSFFGSMFLDKDGNVLLFGPKEYFSL